MFFNIIKRLCGCGIGETGGGKEVNFYDGHLTTCIIFFIERYLRAKKFYTLKKLNKF
jgi:hypothetical protein